MIKLTCSTFLHIWKCLKIHQVNIIEIKTSKDENEKTWHYDHERYKDLPEDENKILLSVEKKIMIWEKRLIIVIRNHSFKK